MSDQAAAEALVAVGSGRLGVGNAGTQTEDESELDAEQPKRKRARRGKTDKGRSGSRKERDEEDIAMEGNDDELDGGDKSGRSPHKRLRDPNGSSWGDTIGDSRPAAGRGIHVIDAGSSSSATSPAHDYAQSVPRGVQASEAATLEGRYAPHSHLQRGFNSPHGGFDLPPLNAALGGGEIPGGAVGAGGRGYGGYGFSGTPSSYMRSGSSAPSRTHSPLGPGGMGSNAYLLPLPHMQALQHSHPYYSGVGASQPSMSALHGTSPPPGGEVGMVMLGGVPTLSELERHYLELHEQRKKMEEMLEKTDRLLVGMKRGIDEMRSGSGQQETQVSAAATNAVTVPIRTPGVERERSRESVWPVVESPSRE